MNRSTPSSPSRAKARRSVRRPSSGSWSILKSPVCSTVPAGVRTATASASGIEWLTATNSHSNGPNRSICPSRTASVYGVIRCSLSFASTKARVSCEPTSGMSGAQPQQVRDGADVVLVAVRQDDGDDVVEAVAMEEKSGRIRSTPGWLSSGKSTPQSMIEQPAGVLEDGHVAADLAEAAEGDDAQAVRREARRRAEFGVRMAHRAPRCARSAVAGAADGSLARSRHRTPLWERSCAAARPRRPWRTRAAGASVPVGRTPCSCSAALAVMAPWVRVMTA